MSEELISAAEIAATIAGAKLLGDGSVRVTGVSTDARKVRPGELFVGLRGERFDGTDFAGDALGKGAAAVLVSRPVQGSDAPQIVVPDVGRAFSESAAAWRRRFTIPVILVSGSNGKTTTTQMIASVLRAAFGEQGSLATEGNFNNGVGVPITLWRLRRAHRAAVVEAGMSHVGEMAELAAEIAPTVALVNNAQREHQEFLPNVEATAVENGRAIEALPEDGVAVFPADDACAGIWRRDAAGRRTMTFATQPGTAADVTAEVFAMASSTEVRMKTPAGDLMVRLAIAGAHNGRNACAAAACALAAGIPLEAVAEGLRRFRPVARRGVRTMLPSGVLLIDDTYNANPDSMRAAIRVLAGAPAPRVLIAGDMGEVGSRGVEYHEEIGRFAAESGVQKMLCCGTLMACAARAFGPGARHFASFGDLQQQALGEVSAMKGGTVLVKASNFMHFDRIVKALQEGGCRSDQTTN